ncbi:hypothetical protein L1887_49516 [Cichorium endivia]|nr:hypothetical protein L1887_49516 [Cichorium endivia]
MHAELATSVRTSANKVPLLGLDTCRTLRRAEHFSAPPPCFSHAGILCLRLAMRHVSMEILLMHSDIRRLDPWTLPPRLLPPTVKTEVSASNRITTFCATDDPLLWLSRRSHGDQSDLRTGSLCVSGERLDADQVRHASLPGAYPPAEGATPSARPVKTQSLIPAARHRHQIRVYSATRCGRDRSERACPGSAALHAPRLRRSQEATWL